MLKISYIYKGASALMQYSVIIDGNIIIVAMVLSECFRFFFSYKKGWSDFIDQDDENS